MKNLLQLAIALLLVSSLVMLSPQNSNATLYQIAGVMTSAEEVPTNNSIGTGTMSGDYDDVTNIMNFAVAFDNLSGLTNNAHFHAPAPPGVNNSVVISWTTAGFPLNVDSGFYSQQFTFTAQQETWLLDGLMYSNIHTSFRPGGEIRAQMTGGTLPVELASFVSAINGNDVTLNWSTSGEVNNAGFDIERKSTVSNDWTKINHVNGHGNSIQQQNYSVTDRGLAIGSYNYRLKQIDLNGNFEYFQLNNEVNIGTPNQYNLSQNYPNPFNPTTRIDFEIPENGIVNLKLFDITGREIETLVNDFRAAGYYNINLDASNLASGVYYYTLTSGNFVSTKKLNIIK